MSMIKSTSKKKAPPRALFLTIEDIDFWLSVGCVCPSMETLTEISRNARRIKREKGNVIIKWEEDGSFLVTNPSNIKSTK